MSRSPGEFLYRSAALRHATSTISTLQEDTVCIFQQMPRGPDETPQTGRPSGPAARPEANLDKNVLCSRPAANQGASLICKALKLVHHSRPPTGVVTS